MTTKMLGTIKLGEKVMVSDPCYGLNTWCQGVLDNVRPGIYECDVEYHDKFRSCVLAIEAIHMDAGIVDYSSEDFEVGVDSGTAGIFDYEYYKKYHSNEDECPEVNEEWYERAGEATFTKESAGILDDLGFVSSSGYGDGGYTCYTAKNKYGQIIAIRIEFIDKDEEECDDEDEYYEDEEEEEDNE